MSDAIINQFGLAIETYGETLNFAEAAKAQGVSRSQLAAARADHVDLDTAFRNIEDAKLDTIAERVMNRAEEDPTEAKFVLRSKRPLEWGGQDRGPGGQVQLNIQVNLYPEDD